MCRVCAAKLAPHVLTDDQKENRVEVSQELPSSPDGHRNILKNIIAGDRMWGLWLWCWSQDAVVWVGREMVSSTKKKMDLLVQDQSVLGCFFFIEKALSTTNLYYAVSWWSDSCVRKFEGCGAQKNAWIMGKSNLDVTAPRYPAQQQTFLVPHPPYSPDLPPADFFFSCFTFHKLRTTLKRRRFQTVEVIQENVIRELSSIRENVIKEAFLQWMKLWERCISSTGDYYEENSA